MPEANDTHAIDVDPGQATKKIVVRAAGGAAILVVDDSGVFALFVGDKDDALPDQVLEGSITPESRFAYATDKHHEHDAYGLVDRQAGPYDQSFVVYGTTPEVPTE
jgi:hypothetical protein